MRPLAFFRVLTNQEHAHKCEGHWYQERSVERLAQEEHTRENIEKGIQVKERERRTCWEVLVTEITGANVDQIHEAERRALGGFGPRPPRELAVIWTAQGCAENCICTETREKLCGEANADLFNKNRMKREGNFSRNGRYRCQCDRIHLAVGT